MQQQATLVAYVDARLDTSLGQPSRVALDTVRDPAAPPTTPQKHRRRRHIERKSLFKSTEHLHESFDWLENYIAYKYDELMKTDSIDTLDSDCLLEDGSSSDQAKELSRETHRRTHARKESLLIGLFDAIDDVDAILMEALAS